MKTFICVLTAVAFASIAPTVASAADLGEGYEERGAYIERPPPPPVRYAAPRYYEPDYYYDDAPAVTYYPYGYYRPYRYYQPHPYYRPYYSAGYYPYRWARPFHRWHHAYWGPGRWR